MKLKNIVICAFLSALLIIVQVSLAFLPNIELVSLLIIIYTLTLKRKTLYIIYTFALIEGLIYGFGIWWFMYLYIWTILYLIVSIFYKNKSVVIWAIISCIYGLAFGLLCSLPYLIFGGIGAAISIWISGIPFDIMHGISNFFVTLILFNPIYSLLKRLFYEQ